MNQLSPINMNHIHGSSSSSSSSYSHASFPFIGVAIIGIFATILLLVFYYIFVIKCCLNWHPLDILRRFSIPRTTNHYPLVHSSPDFTGLHESIIRSIPIFRFQKQTHSDIECAVCLVEFEDNEKLRVIPNCAHVFHIDCIDVWLQNNPNCPLCRNSISIPIPVPIPSHIPLPEPTPRALGNNEQDYVVIELSGGSGSGVGHVAREDQSLDSREFRESREPVTRKLMEKLRKRYGYDSSMGDECIGVNTRRKGDEQFLIQPIRRSISMDSAADRQLYLAVQEIRNSLNYVDLTEVNDDGCSSNGNGNSNRIRRGFFSFGHGRSAILPFHLKP